MLILYFNRIPSISFAILEAMLILYFNRIPSANAWNEGPINQDVVFSKNNVSYAPVVLFAVRTGRRRSASGTKRVVKFISVAILIKAFKFLAASKITVIIISSTPMIAVVEFSLDHGVHIGSR